MAFRKYTSTRERTYLHDEYVVENGQTISYGDLVQLANGVVRRMASGSVTVLGLCETFDDSTGNAAGTVTIKVNTDPGAIYEVPQGTVLADNACQPGDTLDINATADGLAASANTDFVVWHHDATNNLVYVQVIPTSRLFT